MSVTLIHSIAALRTHLQAIRKANKRIGFVPTMGNLHAGHLSLIELANQHADYIVVSIFVNPMQFGPTEDFEQYPRTLKEDLEKLNAQGFASVVFNPPSAEIYPANLNDHTQITVPTVSAGLCGASRPHFFQEVATIVAKLLNIVQPDSAVFGEKDRQQLMVIQKMVNDLSLPIDIISGPIVRESTGLAMSSRNRYLSPAAQQTASLLYKNLNQLKTQLQQGTPQFNDMLEKTRNTLEKAGFELDYLQLTETNLSPAREPKTDKIIFVAALLENTRLIDNLYVTLS